MAISPVMYRSPGTPGATLKLPVEIQNLDQNAVRITLQIQAVHYHDWTYGAELGTATKYDCSGWFAVKSYVHTIDANATYTIPLQCKVPKQLPPGYYYCLGTIEPTVDANNPNKIHAVYQIPIIVRVGNVPKPQLQFGSPKLDVQEKFSTIAMPFINDGDAFAVIGANVILRDATRRVVVQRLDADRNLYPQTKRELSFSVQQKLPDGRYTVEVTCVVNLQTFRPIVAEYVVTHGKAVPASAATLMSLPPFTVDPPVFHTDIPINGTRYQTITFINQTATPLNVQVSARKLTQASNGLFQVLDDAPSAPLSIGVTPALVAIPGRGSAHVQVSLFIGPGATGDSWFAISAVSTAKDSLSQEIYGSVRIKGTETPKLQIVQKETGKVGETPISIDYEVTNTGNIALLPRISASVMVNGLTPIAKLEVPVLGDGGILPGVTLRNKIQLPPDLKPGAYSVRLEYQYAESKDGQAISEIRQLPFNVPATKKSKSGGAH